MLHNFTLVFSAFHIFGPFTLILEAFLVVLANLMLKFFFNSYECYGRGSH